MVVVVLFVNGMLKFVIVDFGEELLLWMMCVCFGENVVFEYVFLMCEEMGFVLCELCWM